MFVTTHYMDEAENCNRMALIYKGNIIAMGTPEEMKTKNMKSDIVEIKLPNSEEWMDRIKTIEGVEEVALFGTSLHVVAENAKTVIPAIEKLFSDAGIRESSVVKIKASLEDVFVSAIETYDKEHPA